MRFYLLIFALLFNVSTCVVAATIDGDLCSQIMAGPPIDSAVFRASSETETERAFQSNNLLFAANNASTGLAIGQIRFLYLWVHPAWDFIGTKELNDNKRFIDALKSSPKAALVQIPDVYGPNLSSSWLSDGSLRPDVKKLFELNQYAKSTLGARFVIWPGKFLDGSNQNQVELLRQVFNLSPEMDNDYFSITDPYRSHLRTSSKFLARIVVYGKMPDCCSLSQATQFGLGNIAHSVRHVFEETPADLIDYPESYSGPMGQGAISRWSAVGSGTYYGGKPR